MSEKITIGLNYQEAAGMLNYIPADQLDKVLSFMKEREAELFEGIHPALVGIVRSFYLQKTGYIFPRAAQRPFFICSICGVRDRYVYALTTGSVLHRAEHTRYNVCKACEKELDNFLEKMPSLGVLVRWPKGRGDLKVKQSWQEKNT